LGHLPDLFIKYDTSHSVYDNGDYLLETKKWGHRFAHVHIKGSLIVGGERYDDPPAGMDQINWGAFISALYRAGYDGTLSIEPHSETWKGELGEKGVNYTIRYMKNLL
jgi:sugar phosphate isomerase/epimerase